MTLAYWGFSWAHIISLTIFNMMTTEQKRHTMFIGVDVHKDTHTAVGVSPFGEKLFEITVGNYQKDFRSLAGGVGIGKKNVVAILRS